MFPHGDVRRFLGTKPICRSMPHASEPRCDPAHTSWQRAGVDTPARAGVRCGQSAAAEGVRGRDSENSEDAVTPMRPQRKALLSDHPLFFAHRGGSLLAPENTFVAFDRGAALGADALELDIHATRDGALVVIHDPTLDRTTDGAGPVAARTLDELR